MMMLLRNPLLWVWGILVLTTLVSWYLGTNPNAGAAAESITDLSFTVTAGIVLIAVIKMRFVMWYFMEVRLGPSWLRHTCDAWLIAIIALVLGLYQYSL